MRELAALGVMLWAMSSMVGAQNHLPGEVRGCVIDETGGALAGVGYRLNRQVRIDLSVFNLFNAANADIDYFYVSRLTGEPAEGVADFHTHPAIPRTARVNLVVGF
jgi:hypothetical protein